MVTLLGFSPVLAAVQDSTMMKGWREWRTRKEEDIWAPWMNLGVDGNGNFDSEMLSFRERSVSCALLAPILTSFHVLQCPRTARSPSRDQRSIRLSVFRREDHCWVQARRTLGMISSGTRLVFDDILFVFRAADPN